MKSVCGVCGVRETWVSWADIDAWSEALDMEVDAVREMIERRELLFACESCKNADEGWSQRAIDVTKVVDALSAKLRIE